MNIAATMLLVLCNVPTQASTFQENRIVQAIRAQQFERIAVWPYAVPREGENYQTDGFFGELHGKAIEMARRIQSYLMEHSRDAESNYRFELVPLDEMAVRVADVTYKQLLTNSAVRKSIAKDTGADAIVIAFGEFPPDPDGRRLNVTYKVYGLQPNDKVGGNIGLSAALKTEEVAIDLSLSDVAYMGRPFEVRRWSGDRLDPIGLDEFKDAESQRDLRFAYGPEAAIAQLGLLNKAALAPLTSKRIGDSGFRILVDGNERPLIPIEDKLYVELNAGESYAIELSNDTGHDLLFGLFIDGMNTVRDGQESEHPMNQPSYCHWAVNADTHAATVNGPYFFGTDDGQDQVATFRVDSAEASAAAKKGVYAKLGMITVIVYTNGMKDIHPTPWYYEFPPNHAKGAGVESILNGTAYGDRQKADLEKVAAEKGLMLGAMTVYYRDAEWFKERLRK